MRLFQQWLSVFLALQLGGLPLAAQPVLTPPNPFQPPAGTGVANLRVTQQSKDGTEAVLTMDYTYDGFGGPTALAAPVIEKRDQKGVSGWFGADFASISRGRGIVSIKVRYFNDEPGVPPQFASDRLRILILNHNGTRVLSSIPFLKTIKWGSADAKPAVESISARAEEDRQARQAEARVQVRRGLHAQKPRPLQRVLAPGQVSNALCVCVYAVRVCVCTGGTGFIYCASVYN